MVKRFIKLAVSILISIFIASCGGVSASSDSDENNTTSNQYPPIDKSIKVVDIPIIKEGDI